ncbi:MAG: hypothetical protein U9N85_11490, partial [Bacteroidota bacterium]|nr:hypothetical protein [Bacteroidota bacterium]
MLLFTGILSAQEEKVESKSELTIGAEFVPRTEYKHGYKVPVPEFLVQDEYTTPANLSTAQRTRLNLNYKTDKVKYGLSLQDVRIWGSQSQLVKNEDFAASIHQAWAEFLFTDEFSLKAGRMELAYDDHRILGNVGWAPQARSHDLALFKYKGDIKVHLGLAYHGGPYTGDDAYKAMQFLWLHGESGSLGYSLLAVNNGLTENGVWFNQSTGDFTGVVEKNAYSQTLGGHFTYKTGALKFALNTYYQTGKKVATWVDENSLPTGLSADDFGLEA